TLLEPTEIQVSVTDSGNPLAIGRSPALDVWVDTGVPTIVLMSPGSLCGSFQQATGAAMQTITYTATDALVVVQVVNGASTTTYNTPGFSNGVATFTN